ncbi:Fpg/Nei family DNA glycosylase [Stackebrandtia soli]|uniref:Fpg/Nei family DNA glycosylase n=1 Tax=Stackebrandtia soli TaxID=1892856 RepID=UPI0039ECF766
MPEGHVIHRLAGRYADAFGGDVVRVDSPQGRFADGAKRVDDRVLTSTDAHGKQLFIGFGENGWIRVHLGLYGKVAFGDGPPPAPVGAIRLRISTESAHAELRGPTVCELLTSTEKSAVHDRLGPDPLREDADPDDGWKRVRTSRVSIASLLMNQRIAAGVGNIYRAEVLFRQGIDPYRLGRNVTRDEWDRVWGDLVTLMRDGVRTGRIDTVAPQHTPEAMNRPPRVDDHGGEVYVYRRFGADCLVCGESIRTDVVEGRNLFWCPGCQKG